MFKIIFVTGMIRSGSTLHMNLVSGILNTAGIKHEKAFCADMDEIRAYLNSDLDDSVIHIIKTHVWHNEIGELLKKGTAKCVYIYREQIFDVAASLKRKTNTHIDEHLFNLKNALLVKRQYLASRNTLVSVYERVYEDVESEIERIAAFLDVDIPKQLVANIAKDNSLKKVKGLLKKQKYMKIKTDPNNPWALEDADGEKYIMYNDSNFYHKNHITSDGGPGGYRNALSEEEIVKVASVMNEIYSDKIIKIENGEVEIIKNSYTQNFEEVLINRAFQNKSEGFYIDIGANDPDTHSITKLFYVKGWTGINIIKTVKATKQFKEKRQNDINIVLDTGKDQSINDIFEIHSKGREIDFIHINVNGNEKDIVLGVRFDRYRPKLIVCRAIKPLACPFSNEYKDEEQPYHEYEGRILNSDYSFVYFDGLNRYYLANEHSELKRFFRCPIGCFDDINSAGLYEMIYSQKVLLDKYANLVKKYIERINIYEKENETLRYILLDKKKGNQHNF